MTKEEKLNKIQKKLQEINKAIELNSGEGKDLSELKVLCAEKQKRVGMLDIANSLSY